MKAHAIATGSSTEDGGYNFAESSRLLAEDFLNTVKAGQLLRVEIVRQRSSKTQKQLGNIFGNMLNSIIAQCNDDGIDSSDLISFIADGRIPKGAPVTKDLLHELMYLLCPTTDDEGRRVTLSKMDTVQANEVFERFRMIFGPMGIVVNDPDRNWREEVAEVIMLTQKKTNGQ